MNHFLDSFRKSFSARLSFWVVLFAALIYLLSLLRVSLVGRASVRSEAIHAASQVLDNSVLRLNGILEDTEIAANNLEWLVYRHLNSPDTLMSYSRSTVQGSTFLNGCSISLEPYYYEGEKYFSAYSGWVGDRIDTKQEGEDNYQYYYLDWYLLPKILRQPCWSEPYSDWDIDDDPSLMTQMLISYCKPLTEKDGSYIGTITLDLDLNWLSNTLSTVKPYPDSYCFMLSRGGTYLIHPDENKLLKETIYTSGLVNPDPEMDELADEMLSWKEGMKQMTINGMKSYVLYRPLRATGWSVALVCPEKDIFRGFDRMRMTALGILLAGLLLMFGVCFLVIRRSVRPLNDLASQAEDIASGHFDTVLPALNRTDEIGTLSRSFSHMQESLVANIERLTQTTAKKERIEGELQIARSIQMSMVPRKFPAFPERNDVDLYAFMTPAKEVGGDLYDFFLLNDRLYFCIGDVSGKGVPASLFMAVVRSLFRVASQQEMSPVEIASRINETVVEENEQLMFITMFIGVLDLKTGAMDFCNCGHNPPLVLSRTGGAPEFLSCKANTCIGVIPNFAFEGQSIPSFHGKSLLLFTDGLNEAENESHEEFGNQRIVDTIASAPYVDAQTTVSLLIEAVSAHVGNAKASDDLTLMCLTVL